MIWPEPGALFLPAAIDEKLFQNGVALPGMAPILRYCRYSPF